MSARETTGPAAARKPHTVTALVRQLDQIRRHAADDGGELSYYQVAKRAGVDINMVQRFFEGYARLGPRAPVADRTTPGRVQFGSALAIVQALGCELEIVPAS